MKNIEIPIWNKYMLSVEEASIYFRIGEKKIRKIAEENQDADFLCMNGSRILIKRKKFEEYVDRLEVV